jgi:dihydroorotase
LDKRLDIAISGGKIAKVARGIPSAQSKQVIDAGGKIVTPGLIDIHCHVYDVMAEFNIGPDGADFPSTLFLPVVLEFLFSFF